MPPTYAPCCTLAPPSPPAWRVTIALPDGGEPIGLSLLADTGTEAAFNALELAGPGAIILRVKRQGEW